MKFNYKHTIAAGMGGSVVQAIVVNFAPLLYVSFQKGFGLSLTQLALLSTINFGIQLIIDGLASKFVDKIGYKICYITANTLVVIGLFMLGTLPFILSPYAGIIASVAVFSVGGGLLEVVSSPLVEACPTKNKAATMSILHSAYSWGMLAVILISTGFFALFGIENWRYAAFCWAALPLANIVAGFLVPYFKLPSDGKASGIKNLIKSGVFWLLFVAMICVGAAEQAVSQWSSTFAETALGVSKTLGDLICCCGFALLMAIARLTFGKIGERIPLEYALTASVLGCITCYLLIALSQSAITGLVGCIFTGLFIAILWPATLSMAIKILPFGGTAVFALLALAGDTGATVAPTIVGTVADVAAGGLRTGILVTIVFPVIFLLIMLIFLIGALKRKKQDKQLTEL